MITADQIIANLGLQPLPQEGGFFLETYKSEEKAAPTGSSLSRSMCSAIYYLITPESFSALHRIKCDEIFHFYAGDAVKMVQISKEGNWCTTKMGADILKDEKPQVVVPKNIWQGLKLVTGGKWALLGTTVSPGFAYEDFEIGKRDELILNFPRLEKFIHEFTNTLRS